MPAAAVSPVSSVPEALDRYDMSGDSGVRHGPDEDLPSVLATVPDPRDPRGLRYPMALLLAIAILATAAGMRGFAGYAAWARAAPTELSASLGLTKRCRPSDRTFRRVLGLIDPADPDRRLGAYFAAIAVAANDGQSVAAALDGRTLRLAKRMGASAAHLVSAFAHHARLVVGQLAVSDKSSEMPTVRVLLKTIKAAVRAAGSGAEPMITIDAMHTRTAAARLVRKTLGWRYTMVAKENQPGMPSRLTSLPWRPAPVVATDCDDKPSHGRIETRTFQILTATAEMNFPHARRAIRVVRERRMVATGERSREIVYAICSAPFELAEPHEIAQWLRMHWGIENSVCATRRLVSIPGSAGMNSKGGSWVR